MRAHLKKKQFREEPGWPNTIGRLTRVGTGRVLQNYTAYDGMGNVTASSEQTAGQTYSFVYSYNLTGALATETYPERAEDFD